MSSDPWKTVRDHRDWYLDHLSRCSLAFCESRDIDFVERHVLRNIGWVLCTYLAACSEADHAPFECSTDSISVQCKGAEECDEKVACLIDTLRACLQPHYEGFPTDDRVEAARGLNRLLRLLLQLVGCWRSVEPDPLEPTDEEWCSNRAGARIPCVFGPPPPIPNGKDGRPGGPSPKPSPVVSPPDLEVEVVGGCEQPDGEQGQTRCIDGVLRRCTGSGWELLYELGHPDGWCDGEPGGGGVVVA